MSLPASFPARLRRMLLLQMRLFLLALGFLTRLAPAMRATSREMAQAARYYPLVGLLLGAILLIPSGLGLFSDQPGIQAWAYVLGSAWLTRALHLDGLADVLDGLGSGRQGEDFWEVLKDSRLGAFGATGLVLVLGGQIVTAAALFDRQITGPLLYAPIFGRSLPVLLSLLASPRSAGGLGALVAQTSGLPATVMALGAIGAGGLFLPNLLSLLFCIIGGCLPLLFLSRLARRQGGYNGDFFGALIVCGELCALVSPLLLQGA